MVFISNIKKDYIFFKRYNFVTPLTSIVVLKDEDREEVEQKLKEDEEKEKLAKLTTTTAIPTRTVPTTRPPVTNKPFTQSPTSDPYVNPNYGGVFRDPHVVLPLKPGVNLCFNWNGEDKEVCCLNAVWMFCSLIKKLCGFIFKNT